MNMFLITFAVMALVIAGMAIGVIMGKEPLKGSCGGIQKLGLKGKCEICGDDPQICEDEKQKDLDRKLAARQAVKDLAYDATSPSKNPKK